MDRDTYNDNNNSTHLKKRQQQCDTSQWWYKARNECGNYNRPGALVEMPARRPGTLQPTQQQDHEESTAAVWQMHRCITYCSSMTTTMKTTVAVWQSGSTAPWQYGYQW